MEINRTTLARQIRKIPGATTLEQKLRPSIRAAASKSQRTSAVRKPFTGSADYWEQRYSVGGNSGRGSRGVLAEYKASFLNDFIVTHDIASVTELGCGNGAQIALGKYPQYVGLDVSATAVRSCIKRFADDPTKTFSVYASGSIADPRGLLASDVAVSLDVLFHLVEQEVFELYIRDLFSLGRRFVIIYASDKRPATTRKPVTNRPFTGWIEQNISGWKLQEQVPNPHAWNGDPRTSTYSEFFVYVPSE